MKLDAVLPKEHELYAALIDEHHVKFAVVIVKDNVLDEEFGHANREEVRTKLADLFPPLTPVILMAKNHEGTPIYHGRKDIVDFLATVDIEAMHFKHYHI